MDLITPGAIGRWRANHIARFLAGDAMNSSRHCSEVIRIEAYIDFLGRICLEDRDAVQVRLGDNIDTNG